MTHLTPVITDLRLRLAGTAALRLSEEAMRRRISAEELAERIINIVATDGLFAAVIDG